MGWTVTDMYGIGEHDSWDFEGLAVWFAGRPVVMLDARVCVAGGGCNRGVFQPGGPQHGTQPTVVPVMLWSLGTETVGIMQ